MIYSPVFLYNENKQKKINLHVIITTHSPLFLKAIENASYEYDISEKCY